MKTIDDLLKHIKDPRYDPECVIPKKESVIEILGRFDEEALKKRMEYLDDWMKSKSGKDYDRHVSFTMASEIAAGKTHMMKEMYKAQLEYNMTMHKLQEAKQKAKLEEI